MDALIDFLSNGELPEIEDQVVKFLFEDFIEDYQKSTDEYFPRAHNTLLRVELSRAVGKSRRPKKKSYTYDEAVAFHQKHFKHLLLSQVFSKPKDGINEWFLIDESDRKFLKVS